ncbi:MAG: PaaI family thioesterase [Burkholderiaceae bacterium]
MSALSAIEVQDLLNRNLPTVDHRGEVIESIGASSLRIRLPLRPEYLSRDLPAGSNQVVMSGPVMMGFSDTALYACIHAFYGNEIFAAIVSFNVAFFRIAGADDLVAEAKLLRKGKRLAFAEAHLYSGASTEPCAQITATYAIRPVVRAQA